MLDNNSKLNFKYIDLFAGIGGFHQAMRFLGGNCVLASEIDDDCKQVYKMNFKDTPVFGDITKINPSDIPNFDVLCAGFPCQPFSKAGHQKGFEDENRGNLFYNILEILDFHKEVKFIILENVRNLADKNENWEIITTELRKRDFIITESPVILSPTDFGIPQYRERVYILGINKNVKNPNIVENGTIHIDDLNLSEYLVKAKLPINYAWKILQNKVDERYYVSDELNMVLNSWDEFKNMLNTKVAGFPIWLSYFGIKNYDEDDYKINIGFDKMPPWKQTIVMKNRRLYLENLDIINEWFERCPFLQSNKLYQKFEWNCGIDCKSVREGIIQVRQSGIRVKRSNFFPSLVAMNNTPIIWDTNFSRYRYISPKEAAKLQNFNAKFKLHEIDSKAYKQLGNSVNVRVIKILGKRLFSLANEGWENDETNKY